MSDFSIKLRTARIICGYSIKEAVLLIREAGLLISEKTLYNWESGLRTPDADAFMVMCSVYNIKCFDQFDGLLDERTKKENDVIRKYRALDPEGQARVDNTLNYEYERIEKNKTAVS